MFFPGVYSIVLILQPRTKQTFSSFLVNIYPWK